MTFTLDPIWTTLAAAVAMVLGAKLKSMESFKNRWIPIITLFTTFIGQVVAAATAQAFGLGDVVKGITWANSLIVWLATTGIFSVTKNTIQGKTSDSK